MTTSSSPTSRLITARGATTRARIVAAAADLIYAQGVGSTSLDDVMRASATSKSQLYHYFADKDALVAAVTAVQAERVLAFQGALLDRVETLADLGAWRDAILSGVAQTSGAGGCPLGTLAGDVADCSELARTRAAEGFGRWQARLAECLARLQDRAEIDRDAEPDDLALGVIAALQGGLLLAQTTRSTRPLRLALDMALRHLAYRTG